MIQTEAQKIKNEEGSSSYQLGVLEVKSINKFPTTTANQPLTPIIIVISFIFSTDREFIQYFEFK